MCSARTSAWRQGGGDCLRRVCWAASAARGSSPVQAFNTTFYIFWGDYGNGLPNRVRYGTVKQFLKGCKKASRQSAADSDGCQVVEGHLPPWCGLMELPRRCFSARRASTPSCARPYPRSLRWRHRDAGDLHPFGALAALAKGQVQKGLALVGRRVEGAGASLGEGIGLAGPL